MTTLLTKDALRIAVQRALCVLGIFGFLLALVAFIEFNWDVSA